MGIHEFLINEVGGKLEFVEKGKFSAVLIPFFNFSVKEKGFIIQKIDYRNKIINEFELTPIRL